MKIISHRGNTIGPSSKLENSPASIVEILHEGFDAEIDVWVLSGKKIFLGHDQPEFQIDLNWLDENKNNLWLHCKNVNALEFFTELSESFMFFFHNTDAYTLVSNGLIWAYPGQPLPNKSISVLPELNRDKNGKILIPEHVYGVCTDYPYEIAKNFG